MDPNKRFVVCQEGGSEEGVATGATPEQLVGEVKALLEVKGVEIPEGAGIPEVLQAVIAFLKGAPEGEEGGGEGAGEEVAASEAVLARLGLKKGATEEQVLVALAERGKDAVPMSEYKALKTATEGLQSRLDARDKADRDSKVETLIGKGFTEGKLLPNDAETLKWFREQAEANSQNAEKILETMAVKVPQGQLSPVGPDAKAGRDRIIASSAKDWSENPSAQVTAKESWVAGTLRDAGLPPLTDDEKKSL